MLNSRTRWLSLFACTSALVACGDDSPAGGSSAGGNNNGGEATGGNNTGAGQQGGDNPGGAPNGGAGQGGGAQGGAAQGGAAQGGAAQGGGGQGGAANSGADGANCVDDTDCDNGFCMTEADFGVPGGMCTEDCTASNTCAGAGSSCVDIGGGNLFCLRDCDPVAAGSCGAPTTLTCFDATGTPLGGVCFGTCQVNGDCTVASNQCQEEPDGFCAPPEDCANAIDDDFDGDTDCGDSDCAALPACVIGTCAMPATALAVNSNTTVGGSALLDSTCAPTSGNEAVYTFTSPVTGGLFVGLASETDQGIHVRTTCTDDASEIACADAEVGGTNEFLATPIAAGQTVFIIVDAFAAGEEGPYTLTVETLTEVCDDLIDGDADGSMDCADSPECNGTAACTPGATALNGPCTANTECASVAGADPACLTTSVGINANMCSEWCNLAANDCGAGKTCFDIGLDQGWCFTSCTLPANCPTDFDCVDVGAASDVCLPGVPAAWTCDVTFFNDTFCDCGCGAADPDCANGTVGVCEFCDDPGSCSATACPGTIDPTDNTTCN